MDDVFLPAVHEALLASHSRTFPVSYTDAASKAQLQARNLTTGPRGPRLQLLAYQIQP